MKYAPWMIVLLLAAVVGCTPEPRPAPGLSALRIKVVAKPKIGTSAGHPSSYDSSSDVGHGTFERVDYSDLQDIVVWVEPAATRPTGKNPQSPAAIPLTPDGKSTALSGVASVGQTIAFRNNSAIPISAYSVSDGNQFNLGTLAPGQEQKYVARMAGLIEILSDSAETPIATIYVAPASPVFLTHSGAIIDVNDLSPGPYLVVSWHPRLPGSVADVELAPERVTHVTIDVGVNGLPKIERK